MAILLGKCDAEIATLEAEEADLQERLGAARESRTSIVARLLALGVQGVNVN